MSEFKKLEELPPKMRSNFETITAYQEQHPGANIQAALKETGVTPSQYWLARKLMGLLSTKHKNIMKDNFPGRKAIQRMGKAPTQAQQEIYDRMVHLMKDDKSLSINAAATIIAPSRGVTRSGIVQQYHEARRRLGFSKEATINDKTMKPKRESISIGTAAKLMSRPSVQKIAYDEVPLPPPIVEKPQAKMKFIYATGNVEDLKQLIEMMGE